jgi:hypothetical protein
MGKLRARSAALTAFSALLLARTESSGTNFNLGRPPSLNCLICTGVCELWHEMSLALHQIEKNRVCKKKPGLYGNSISIGFCLFVFVVVDVLMC